MRAAPYTRPRSGPLGCLALSMLTGACGEASDAPILVVPPGSPGEVAEIGEVESRGYGLDVVSSGLTFEGSEPTAPVSIPIGLAAPEVVRWYVDPPPPGLLGSRPYELEVEAALQTWQQVLATAGYRLVLERVFEPGGSPDILISFADPHHAWDCDGGFPAPDLRDGLAASASDGLAHALDYSKQCMRGVIHLNAGLRWNLNGVNRKGEFDLRTVVIHEVGHLFGLGHDTTDPNATMYELYDGVKRLITPAEARRAARLLREARREAQ